MGGFLRVPFAMKRRRKSIAGIAQHEERLCHRGTEAQRRRTSDITDQLCGGTVEIHRKYENVSSGMKTFFGEARIEVADTASNGPKLGKFRNFLP
jgi:hypothetical protein